MYFVALREVQFVTAFEIQLAELAVLLQLEKLTTPDVDRKQI